MSDSPPKPLFGDEAACSHHSIKGILLIMLGSFSFSVMFLLVKVMKNMNAFTLVFWRSVVQIGISLLDLRRRSVNPLGSNDVRVRSLLALRAVLGAFAVAAWFFGIQNLPLPDAVTLQFTTPPFAGAFAVCAVGERWKPLDVAGAVVCLTGVALIAHPTWLFGTDSMAAGDGGGTSEGGGAQRVVLLDDDGVGPALETVAVLVTTSGAAMAGMAYVCVRKIGDRADAVVMVLYYGVLSLPMAAMGSKLLLGTWNVLGDVRNFSVEDYFLLLLVGFAGYGGQWFTNLGLQIETAATATLATSTQIVWTFIFEILLLHETLNPWSLAGTALILGYMMIVGVIKVVESRKNADADAEDADIEKGVDEKSLLLERKKSPKPKRYSTATVLQWQGSNSF